jgi:hypothetical protein
MEKAKKCKMDGIDPRCEQRTSMIGSALWFHRLHHAQSVCTGHILSASHTRRAEALHEKAPVKSHSRRNDARREELSELVDRRMPVSGRDP